MSETPKVLDVACGSRMFWFDKEDPRVVFCDNRSGSWQVTDSSVSSGKRSIVVAPDVLADFRSLPFPTSSFSVVCFDPPHLVSVGERSWTALKYGRLPRDWADMIRTGFAECFRVLAPNGVLVFKWNEAQVPVSRILELTDAKPLFGNKSGKHGKTHWIVFLKGGTQ